MSHYFSYLKHSKIYHIAEEMPGYVDYVQYLCKQYSFIQKASLYGSEAWMPTLSVTKPSDKRLCKVCEKKLKELEGEA